MDHSGHDLEWLKECLLHPGTSALLDGVRRRAPAIVRALEEAERDTVFDLTDEEAGRIEASPEWVATVYGALGAAAEEGEDGREIHRAIESMRASEAEATAAAFAVLMDTLHPQFAEWSYWFHGVPSVTADERDRLTEHAEVRCAGPHALRLAAYGMTPATVVGAARGVDLLADRLIAKAQGDEAAWHGPPEVIRLFQAVRDRLGSSGRPSVDLPLGPGGLWAGTTVVPVPLLIAQVRGTSGCPPEAAEALLGWMVRVALEKPFFFPGYTAHLVDDVLRLTQDLDRKDADLAKRWSRSALGRVGAVLVPAHQSPVTPVAIADCLRQVREATAARGASDCLYRGEASLYPATRSSHYRLFSESNRFTDDQARAVKDRLLTIAQMLEVVGLGRPEFARAEDALKHAPPMRLEDVNEVIYCFMQHYHLATPFIDLTTDIDVAAAFATEGASKEDGSEPRRGVIYLVSRKGLEELGVRAFNSADSIANRPQRQRAVSLFLERDTNFQALPESVLTRFEFEDTCAALARYDDPDVYDATGDRIAREVAMLAYRCAYEDLASSNPSHGRVMEYFSQIAYRLADAGAVPRA